MQEIVTELSYSDKKELVKEIRKYSASFSRIANSILGGFARQSMEGCGYDSLLKAETEREFPDAKQPMHHIAHWMLMDNGLIDYSASISFDGRNGERTNSSTISRKYSENGAVEKAVKKGVRKYIVTIIARAEGTEKASKFVPQRTFQWNGGNGQESNVSK